MPDPNSSRPSRAVALALLTGCLLALPAAAAERWFHLHVVDGDEGSQVSVNLPLSAVERALSPLPRQVEADVYVELNDGGFAVEDLRQIWRELRDTPDATLITVKSNDETLDVRKDGGYLVAQTVERSRRGAKVDVRFPLAVIDALFAGDSDRLDFAAAIRALADYEGEMVTVEDDDSRVRIWVDGRSAQR